MSTVLCRWVNSSSYRSSKHGVDMEDSPHTKYNLVLATALSHPRTVLLYSLNCRNRVNSHGEKDNQNGDSVKRLSKKENTNKANKYLQGRFTRKNCYQQAWVKKTSWLKEIQLSFGEVKEN